MSMLAPTLQSFFTDRLIRQRNASPHTIAAYRDTLRLLLAFARKRTGKQPSTLDLADLDAPLIGAFLDHLEHERDNSVRTRNARLAAIRSLFQLRRARASRARRDDQRVLAIPPKRSERALDHLPHRPRDRRAARRTRPRYLDRPTRPRDAAPRSPDRAQRVRADRSEAAATSTSAPAPHVSCLGKGRKQRITPLTKHTVAVLRTWLTERAGHPDDPLFPTRTGRTLSRDALERRLAEHATTAATALPVPGNQDVSPHVLRHTAAMRLLHAGIDTTVIALWLGHEHVETTQIYLHADMALKETALARRHRPTHQPGRYQPPDTLLAFLEAL